MCQHNKYIIIIDVVVVKLSHSNSHCECLLSFRELIESEQSQRQQQASVEEQLNTVRQSLLDQNSAAHSLHSGLGAQLENIQKQVTQVTNTQAGVSLLIRRNCHFVSPHLSSLTLFSLGNLLLGGRVILFCVVLTVH